VPTASGGDGRCAFRLDRRWHDRRLRERGFRLRRSVAWRMTAGRRSWCAGRSVRVASWLAGYDNEPDRWTGPIVTTGTNTSGTTRCPGCSDAWGSNPTRLDTNQLYVGKQVVTAAGATNSRCSSAICRRSSEPTCGCGWTHPPPRPNDLATGETFAVRPARAGWQEFHCRSALAKPLSGIPEPALGGKLCDLRGPAAQGGDGTFAGPRRQVTGTRSIAARRPGRKNCFGTPWGVLFW